VVEVIKSTNDKVGEGEPIVRLEPREGAKAEQGARQFCDGRVHAVMYVGGNEAGRVLKGQAARISPTDVKKEEYGYMPGTVEWVATHAASPQDMREKLKNDGLVQQYTQGGAVYEVRVCLVPDETKKSGFRWSSSAGPAKRIDSGALATASMVVAEKKPISYVLPVIKNALGV
jgi:HlyD family secretion protein